MKSTFLFTVLSFLFLCSFSYGQNVFPATGNVGIGTLSPNYNLDINGSISATQIFIGGNPVQSSPWNLSGNNTFYSLGNVGIGTNNPVHTLDVAGTLNATNILLNGTPIDNSPSPWTLSGTTTFFNLGNVGIGTNNPVHTLDVAGTLNATNILLNGAPIDNSVSPWSISGSSTYYTTGNVGIGTDSPNASYALDVAGPMNATEIYLNGSPVNNIPSPWATLGNDLFYASGNIGIGTNNTQGYKLAIAGNVIAEAVKVELQGAWPDFVFEAGYRLPSLPETEAYIKDHGHLPQVPSAEKVKSEGIQLGEMDAILLQKIEELTLHAIQQHKEIEQLNAVNEKLIEQNKMIETLTERLEKLERGTQIK